MRSAQQTRKSGRMGLLCRYALIASEDATAATL
jgi:hypothetical protein